MTPAMPEVKRTLVKSVPELWTEVSDPAALARHLAPFGSVRITRTVAESLVVWEGERAAGRVTLQSSGFGTRVELEATIAGAATAEPEPEPDAGEPPDAPRGLLARVLRLRGAARPEEEAGPAQPVPGPSGEPMAEESALLVLTDALDALGRARHRPFSRV